MDRAQPISATAFILCFAGLAAAQQPTPQERELEQLVRALSQKVDQLESRLNRIEGAPADAPTAARVEKLEQSVQQLKDERPPAEGSEDWAKIKKWVSDESTLRPYWKDGLRLDSGDGSVKLKIGGRIQHDFAYYAEDGSTERRIGAGFDDGTEFRRARFYFSGILNDEIEFKAQYDFAAGDADFKDVYLGFKKVPAVGNLRVGQFKEPFSLEELTSSNDITFLERSLVNTFAPGRNTGVMIHDTMMEKRMTWAAGFFRQTDSFGDGAGGRAYNATARVTARPWYEDGGKKLLHLGVAYTHQNYEDDTLRIRARPEAHLSPRIVDTGSFGAEAGDLIGVEAALVHGPLSIQGEYVHSFVDGTNRLVGNPDFWGASVQASYFLTGEHRPYKTSAGTFSRVKPLENFGKDGGPGAWELAARLSYLNLNDSGVRGGRLRDISLGLNWYLNSNVRSMWSFIHADPSEGGEINAFLWRMQVAF